MKKTLKTAMLLTLTCNLLGLGFGSAQASAANFKDVPNTHWAKNSIDYAVSKGYFKGYADGTFKPNANVTRAEFAALLARVSTNEINGAEGVFPDLNKHWSKQEVEQATGKGFISPSDYPSGFKPGTSISRKEMAKWLAFGLAANDSGFKQSIEDTKDTLIPVTEYYKGGLNKSDYPYVSVVLGTGLLQGYPDGKFGPNNVTTRAEAAVLLQRFESTQSKKASDFRGLQELREVGTTGTNLTTVTPYKYGENAEIKNIIDKNIMLRKGAGKVKLHHLIVMNVKKWNDINSIYGPMFVDKDTRLPFKNDSYHVFIDVTVTPISKNFVVEHFINGAISGLETGFRISGNVTKTFGYKSLPIDGDPAFFSQKGTRFWAETSIANSVEPNKSEIYDIKTEDNTKALIIMKG